MTAHALPQPGAAPTAPTAPFRLVRIEGGVRVCVPDDLTLMTPYVLVEQEDWFEDEIAFVRQLTVPGLAAIDIGANYGVYTLTLAKLAGPEGRVWAFEPAPNTAAFLGHGIADNAFETVTLIQAALSDRDGEGRLSSDANTELRSLHGPAPQGSEVVRLTTLDGCRDHWSGRSIDFVKLDAEGEEANVIRGGAAFFTEQSPLVMFEVKHGDRVNLDLVDRFTAIGYDVYRLVPGLAVLEPFDRTLPADAFLLNLFAAKPDRAEALDARGLLVRTLPAERAQAAPTAWYAALAKQPWAVQGLPNWQPLRKGASASKGWTTYRDALNAYAVSQEATVPIGQRLAALHDALRLLVQTVGDGGANFPRLCSLARVAAEAGQRHQAVATLDRLRTILLEGQMVGLSEPFLPVDRRFDTVNPKNQLVDWMVVGILETLDRLGAFSSYFAPQRSRDLLALVKDRAFVSAQTTRRLTLVSGGAKRAATGAETESLVSVLPADMAPVAIVDIGAMMVDGAEEPYTPLVRQGKARIIGFEPDAKECERLNRRHGAPNRFFPFFVGDGRPAVFHETNMTFTGSLFPPNTRLLEHYPSVNDVVRPVADHPVETKRLDDIAEIGDVDMIKIDVQGSELAVFQGADRALDQAVLIQTEVEFVEIYQGQPLFGDIDRHLRARGFQFYCFDTVSLRALSPVAVKDKPHTGLRQFMWADAVYVRDILTLDRLADEKLLKLALLAHDLYRAYDLAWHALSLVDKRRDRGLCTAYRTLLGRVAPDVTIG